MRVKNTSEKKSYPKDNKRTQLEDSLTETTDQIAHILLSTDTNIKISNSTWTIADAGAHLVISQGLFKGIIKGKKSPYEDGRLDVFAKVNEELLENFPERGGKNLAKQLIASTNLFLKESEHHKNSYRLKTHFGDMNLVDLLTYSLCHLLMHGSDIARTSKNPTLVKEKYVELIVPFFKGEMTKHYDKEKAKKINLSIDINILGVSRFTIICHKGELIIKEHVPRSVDCHIKIDPISFFLISTGVASLWKSLLNRKIIIWGKKPWIALHLKSLFPNP